jgi:hypothetical protein
VGLSLPPEQPATTSASPMATEQRRKFIGV